MRLRPEYLIEGAALGCFMLSACAFGTLLAHPASPVHRALGAPWLQRAAMGALMGLTLVAIVYSPWGRRSGAQMNPVLTLTFLRLGRVAPRDAAAYVVAQFAGGALGVMAAHVALGTRLADPAVRYVVTVPGATGRAAAFAAEAAISALLMAVVLRANASPRWMRRTGLVAALLVATYITLEAPVSGMSMNPARTLASALAAREWTALWIYFAAPLVGMLLAAEQFVRSRGRRAVPCGKMCHALPCLFCDHWRPREGMPGLESAPSSAPEPGSVSSPHSMASPGAVSRLTTRS